MIDWLELIGT